MTAAPLHVLIAGAGLSGLALAQGLIKDGHTVDVFERDADLNRKAGYYLTLNPMGGGALRRCLPPDLYELYRETSRRTPDRFGSIVYDPQLHELSSQPHFIPEDGSDKPDTGIHRRTLRQILAARLGERLHLGSAVIGYEEDGEGVTALLSDGRRVRGDVLVAADGIRSAVRQQRLPEVQIVDTGIRGIGVFGRTPLTPELTAQLPPAIFDGVGIAADRSGVRVLLAPYEPRSEVTAAAAALAPDVDLDPIPDYFMISCSTSPGTTIPPADDWSHETRVEIRESMLAAIDGWHPALRALVSGIDLETLFAIKFSYLTHLDNWAPSRVTMLGDAIHAMLPTLGMGANLALNDARLLLEQLDRAARGDATIPECIGDYEQEMRATAYPVAQLTLDHDRNFGGGALKNLE